MCRGKDCPKREGCYRYRALPDVIMQAYFSISPYENENCTCFMSIGLGRKVRSVEAIEADDED